jgi:hypothetical protein
VIFLIEYNRSKGQLVTFESFADTERSVVEDMRLDLELALLRTQIDHEVVLLEAASEAAIRRTHGRYFMTPMELVQRTFE